jgi:hypothetical protein
MACVDVTGLEHRGGVRRRKNGSRSWMLGAFGDQHKETAMLMTILGILVVLWVLGLVANIGGGLIHLLLVIAVIVFLANMFSSRRSV